jgi:2'-deoxynucleoside 5'-phosphate N-hydrolase
MKIYFAGSIRGGRHDAEFYFKIIDELKRHGHVLTEHIGDAELTGRGEQRASKDIFERDMEWVREADAIVAEVTQPSLGVGYEMGQAEAMGKPVLALYRETEGKRLSAMIEGNPYVQVRTYASLEDIPGILEEFFTKVS